MRYARYAMRFSFAYEALISEFRSFPDFHHDYSDFTASRDYRASAIAEVAAPLFFTFLRLLSAPARARYFAFYFEDLRPR